MKEKRTSKGTTAIETISAADTTTSTAWTGRGTTKTAMNGPVIAAGATGAMNMLGATRTAMSELTTGIGATTVPTGVTGTTGMGINIALVHMHGQKYHRGICRRLESAAYGIPIAQPASSRRPEIAEN